MAVVTEKGSIEETGLDLVQQLVQDDGDEAFAARLVEYTLDLLDDEQRQGDPTPLAWVLRDNYDGSILERVDAYDLREENPADRTTVDLFVALAFPTEAARQVSPLEVATAFTPLRTLLRRLLASDGAPSPSDAPELADLRHGLRDAQGLTELRLLLITNGVVRDFDRTPDRIGNVAVKTAVVDLGVIHRLQHPGAIPVDFATEEGAGIPCVALPVENNVYRSFLAVVPGSFIAELYRRHGQHLFEANVRSYLKATGKVNKGVLKTIREEPTMFFAYNNGITATAEEIVVGRGRDGSMILVRCRNLQVVNGGQTTVSLANARERRIPLDKIHVAMKINEVVAPERASELVQSISIYANSQNKVSASDLGANQPFHVRLQKLADREIAPVPAPGESQPAQWYYERMRGQHQQDLSRLSGKSKSLFKARFPNKRVLSKTDVARLVMTWEKKPHIVSLGGEKCYVPFIELVKQWGWSAQDSVLPDAAWYHRLIGLQVLWDACEKVIRSEKIPGYKANIVTYTLALLLHLEGDTLDIDQFWAAQTVSPEISEWLLHAVRHVHQHIVNPPREGMNIGEWCKKPACWEGLLERPFVMPRVSLRASDVAVRSGATVRETA